MPTFYDPAELGYFDMDHEDAHFYILPVGSKYQICATIHPLDSVYFRNGDPLNRITQYWPITRDALREADEATLFEVDDEGQTSLLRRPLTLEEFQEKICKTFNPDDSELMTLGPEEQERSELGFFDRTPEEVAQSELVRRYLGELLTPRVYLRLVEAADLTPPAENEIPTQVESLIARVDNFQATYIIPFRVVFARDNPETDVDAQGQFAMILALNDLYGHLLTDINLGEISECLQRAMERASQLNNGP